jgi:hypothetical protein
MDVSIIINNYKTRGLLKQCLKGIYANPPALNFEVVVIDNNSGDGSVDLVRELFPQVKLIASKENLGHHRGNNLGITNSTGKYVLIVNTDIAFMDDAIVKMFRFMEEHPDVALAGPKLKNPDGSVQMSCMRFPHLLTPIYRRTPLGKLKFAQEELKKYLMEDFDHNSTKPVDWILGACEIVRRSVIEQAGGMDEDLFLYFGDIAWCKKFWESGHPVYYLADCNIIHYHKRESAESGIFSKIFWIHIIDWIKYLVKYYK